MSDIKQAKPTIVEAAQNLWDRYQQIMLAKGLNIGEALAGWTAKQRERLALPGAQCDFDELCGAGCSPQILALLLAFIRHSPELGAVAKVAVGNPKKRAKTLRSLQNASAAFEDIFGVLLTAEDEETRADFAKIGRLPPSVLVSEIRIYVELLAFAEELSIEMEVDSVPELAKYLLAGYVQRATGSFHDRNVSGLIGETLGPADYDEVALRMWRYRNYERLRKNFQGFPELLFDLSFVVTHRA